MEKQIGNKVKKGMLWTFSERIGTKLVQFGLQILLARILVPEDYGLCALLLTFVNISMIFVNSGLGTALIQKKDADEIDLSSVCLLSVGVATFIYVILFLSAPWIAVFFDDPRITLLLRVISITLIVGAFNSVQGAILSRVMNFKFQFVANICGIIASAIISLYMAMTGYGVWAIVAQYIANRIVVTLVLFYQIRWLPQLHFSTERLKGLFSFGWKCMATSFVSTIVTDIYTLVIGKCFTKYQLGSYDTGNKIPSTVSESFTSSLGSVLFAAFSQIQDDKSALKLYVSKSNKTSSFLIFPLMFGLAAAADPIVRIVLTDKWESAIPFLQMACVLYAFYPLHIANIQAINGIGKSNISLRCEIQKKIVDLSFLAVLLKFGIYYVALGRVLTSIIALWINMRPNKKLLDYSTSQQLKDIAPALIISTVMTICMCVAHFAFDMRSLPLLVTQALIGVIVYFSLSYIFNRDQLMSVLQMLSVRKNNV